MSPSLRSTLAVLADRSPLSTGEVLAAGRVSRSTLLRRLHALEAAGCVESIKIGRSLVWTITNKGVLAAGRKAAA